jgi:hypothetical protein
MFPLETRFASTSECDLLASPLTVKRGAVRIICDFWCVLIYLPAELAHLREIPLQEMLEAVSGSFHKIDDHVDLPIRSEATLVTA